MGPPPVADPPGALIVRPPPLPTTDRLPTTLPTITLTDEEKQERFVGGVWRSWLGIHAWL